MARKIIIIGPAHPYRGGIAAFDERLARQLQSEGNEVEICTYSLQYPSFLFPGKTQYSAEPAPKDLAISRRVNSINPFNWLKVGLELRKKQADLIIVAFWMPYFAPALSTIARLSRTRTVALVHNLLPHEHKPGDRFFARSFCRSMDAFATLSDAVSADISGFAGAKPIVCRPHPVYDNFGQNVTKDEACAKLGLDPKDKILLSFGLIRDYKGLDWLIEAFASLPDRHSLKLVVAGEFYSDPEKYHGLARSLGVDEEIIWRTEFVPDSEVKYYFCAADMVVQPYKTATQSGVTQIAYHFGRPMTVTDVGGLGEVVPDGVCGYVAEPSAEGVAKALKRYLSELPDFSEGLAEQKKKYSWESLTKAILELK